MQTIKISTSRRGEMVNITSEVQRLVRESGVKRGLCCVHAPHTTAGITVQEGYDPDVARDILSSLEKLVPHVDGYKHAEGNSDSHIKALMCGSSQILPVEYGELQLGRWQQVFFCEFDGPRSRTAWVHIIRDQEPS
jgi:secondary thiamine-phosphate synthase enzyme